MRARCAIPLALGMGLLAACHRATPAPSDAGESTDGMARPTTPERGRALAMAPEAGAAVAPARCKVLSTGPALGQGADSVLVGDVAKAATGFAIGLLRAAAARTSAVVAVFPEDLSSVTLIDLGPAVGDTPPPKPFAMGHQLFAATYVRQASDGGARRTLGFFRIEGAASSLAGSLEQAVDESVAVDVAAGPTGALVAWDEDAPAGGHGVIKVAPFGTTRVGEARIASPDTSDADEPQVAARTGGYWLAWIAHRAQAVVTGGKGDASVADLEGPAEGREFRWIEGVALDDEGKAIGAVRRLTSASGHASAFTMMNRAQEGGGADALDVFVRDDEEPAEGAGGRILRITLPTEGPSSSSVLVPEGAGRGAPGVTAGTPGWLAYGDIAEHTRLLPLGQAGSTPELSSLEPALDEAALIGSGRVNPALFAIFPGEHASAGLAPIRMLSCAPPVR
jgi:hypothetical protein